MIEIAVIIILSALLAWEKYSNRKEREKFINALIAKNAQELQDLDYVDKLKPAKEEPEIPPDLMPIDKMEVDSKEFKKVIEKETS